MRKNEFLRSLRRRLRRYPSAEVDEALAYYEELIADKMECGKTEAQAVAEFGDVALVAASIAGELDGKYRANGVQTPVSSKRRHSVAYWIFKPFAVLFGLIARETKGRKPFTGRAGIGLRFEEGLTIVLIVTIYAAGIVWNLLI